MHLGLRISPLLVFHLHFHPIPPVKMFPLSLQLGLALLSQWPGPVSLLLFIPCQIFNPLLGKNLAPIPPAMPIHEVQDPDSDTSVNIGPLDAFPILGSRASSRTGSHSAQSVSAFIPPSNGSDSGSDFDSDSSSDEALDPGPWDAFPRVPSTLSANEPGLPTIQSHASDSDTDSDMCEVSATEAAAALADSDLDVGHGAMVLAALVGGRLAIGTHPLPPHGPSDPVIPGPFTAECFPPLRPEMLRESSEDADVDS